MRQGYWRNRAVVALVLLSVAFGGCGKKGGAEKARAKPDELTIIFSSDLLGKIRSCGCVVKDMGGIGRRATYTEGVRSSIPNCIILDAGDDFGTNLEFTQPEAELTVDAMNLMKVDVFTPGETDFVFGVPFLQELIGRSSFATVAANIVDPATGAPLLGPPYVVKTLTGGLRVGITGVLDDAIRFPAYIDASRFKVLPPAETLRKLLPELRQKADFLVLLSHMGLARSTELAQQVPDFDIVIIGHEKPILKKIERQGKTMLLGTGAQGEYVGRIDLSLSGTGGITQGKLHLIPIEDSIEIHPGVKDLFAKYRLVMTEKERLHKK